MKWPVFPKFVIVATATYVEMNITEIVTLDPPGSSRFSLARYSNQTSESGYYGGP